MMTERRECEYSIHDGMHNEIINTLDLVFVSMLIRRSADRVFMRAPGSHASQAK